MGDSRPIAPGRVILVWYGGGEAYWHERLLFCQVQGTIWVIATPSDDIYPENIRALGGRPCVRESVPPAIPAHALLHRFPLFGRLHTNDEWRYIFGDGIATAPTRRVAMGIDGPAADAEAAAVRDSVADHGWGAGIGLPGGQAAAVTPAVGELVVPAGAGPPPAAAGPQDWSVDASAIIQWESALVKLGSATIIPECIAVGSKANLLEARKGELEMAVAAAPPPGGLAAAMAVPPAIAPAASAGSEVLAQDARMGQRFRPYGDGVGLLEESTWADFPIQGSSTTLWLCELIRDQGCVPRTSTEKGMRDARVPGNGRVKYEHGSPVEILEWAITYDKLGVSALASFELLARRIVLLNEAYTANPKSPRFKGSEHFQGLGKKAAAVAPQLTSHVALQLQGEAQIQKERLMAREEATLARKG
ncbi:unnamed protein product [Prorocentrum cordatum]|uniref:Uncharacterized protein n=1 Tax=Prorocentrum cordatum TaxID=2364126 RepID=A0ABN9W4X4_9DINO|nr:unnamed protein product [Polarella glacialis]